MTSKSPSKSVQDYESDADALMDELFRDVEDSFSTPTALPDPDGETSGDRTVTKSLKSHRRSRSGAVPWVVLAVGGLAALSGTVLWWSYVHLPKRLAILSGHGVASSSLSDASASQTSSTSSETAQNSTESSSSSTASTNMSSSAVADAVEGVVEDAVETSATATSDLVATNQLSAIQPNADTANSNPVIANIEVDQAEIDRILAATAPAPVAPPPVVYAPPPPPAPAPPPVPEMTLVGLIAGDNGDPAALVMIGNNMRQVSAGEALTGGWRVASISDRSVSVTNGVQSEVLGL